MDNFAEAFPMVSPWSDQWAVKKRDASAPDFETKPDELATPKWATNVAGWFWSSRRLNALADQGDITERINRGLTGLEEREKFYNRALGVLS